MQLALKLVQHALTVLVSFPVFPPHSQLIQEEEEEEEEEEEGKVSWISQVIGSTVL